MLIEVFTNGSVLIDGKRVEKSYKPEEALYDYLTNPSGFITRSSKNKKKLA